MTEQEFWALIEKTKKKSKKDAQYHQELIIEALEKLPPKEIIAFDNIFIRFHHRAYDHKLWAAAFIIDGGCSDDCFTDFRGWLIGQGQQVYQKALLDPDSLSELDINTDEIEEGYAYCAQQAYEAVTGEDIPADSLVEIHPKEPTGEAWKEEELAQLLPKLDKKYREE